jgi:1-acyl-sn-glycerol-3-phosphate acyltransferase
MNWSYRRCARSSRGASIPRTVACPRMAPAAEGRASELDARWRAGVVVVGSIARALFRVRILDAERIPAAGPAILAANHVSVLDGPLLAWPPAALRGRSIRFIVAAEMFSVPGAGAILRAYGQIPIRRERNDAHAVDAVVGAVRSGALAGIFPEGRVNRGEAGDLQRVRRGAARIAISAQAPVVPVGIWGTQRRWPAGRPRLRSPLRPPVVVAFGLPLQPPQGASPERIDGFTEVIRAAIAAERDRARDARPTPD